MPNDGSHRFDGFAVAATRALHTVLQSGILRWAIPASAHDLVDGEECLPGHQWRPAAWTLAISCWRSIRHHCRPGDGHLRLLECIRFREFSCLANANDEVACSRAIMPANIQRAVIHPRGVFERFANNGEVSIRECVLAQGADLSFRMFLLFLGATFALIAGFNWEAPIFSVAIAGAPVELAENDEEEGRNKKYSGDDEAKSFHVESRSYFRIAASRWLSSPRAISSSFCMFSDRREAALPIAT